ncbi:hypothetical protein B566_EDAN014162 [Ephemera danica]|nr:hypothetical protein B566_EDAN014162 [Ephemera danica]
MTALSNVSNIISKMSLLELAIESSAKKNQVQEQRETTLIFTGNKGAGKTTMVNILLEKNEQPKPTLALDYTFGRRSGKSLAGRDVCHIWELGGGSAFTSLLSAPLASIPRLERATLVLVLDLSRPQHLWGVLEAVTSIVRKLTTKLAEMEPQPHKLMEQAWERVGEAHKGEEYIDPFPIPLVIIGTKYDIFQNLETEKKKVVCRCLRYAALSLGASLYFSNVKDSGVSKRIKDVLTHHAFGTAAPKSICQDVSKPLSIPCGVESLQLIGGPGATSTFKSHSAAMERWKLTYTALYPQEDTETAEFPDDPGKDPNYAEPEIDKLRAQKEEELEKYRQEISRRKHRH